MPRTIDPALKAAMLSGAFSPYVRAVWHSGANKFEYEVKGYKLTGTTLEVLPAQQVGVAYPAYLSLKRGAVVNGTPITIETGKFYIGKRTYKLYAGQFDKISVHCTLFPENRISLSGDVSYQTIITAFCTAFGKTAVFDDPAAAYWGYQFLPAGKQVVLNNAMQFLNLLRQKYFIFAADLGDEEVLFYHGMADRDADYQYSLYMAGPGAGDDIVTTNVFEIEVQPLDQRQYMARDENETLRYGGTAAKPLHNLGYLESTDAFPEKSTQPFLVRAVMGINLFPQCGDIVRVDPAQIGVYAYPVEVMEELAPGEKGIPWRTVVETRRVFENTAGGSLPSTIERVASYTPLITTGFDKVLSANDNNLQAAMETLDNHTHGMGASGFAAGTYTPTLTNGTNVAASTLNADFMYSRLGNTVTVAGSVQVDPTAAGSCTLGISLPIASAFTSSYDLNGNGTSPGQYPGSVIADDTNDRASFVHTAVDGANRFWRLVFVYRVK